MSLLGQVFADKAKVKGQKHNDPQADEKIYKQYLRAYKKGVFNYIKEDATPEGQIIPRKYFSGGAMGLNPAVEQVIDGEHAMTTAQKEEVSRGMTGLAKRALLVVATAFFALTGLASSGQARTTGIDGKIPGQSSVLFETKAGHNDLNNETATAENQQKPVVVSLQSMMGSLLRLRPMGDKSNLIIMENIIQMVKEDGRIRMVLRWLS